MDIHPSSHDTTTTSKYNMLWSYTYILKKNKDKFSVLSYLYEYDPNEFSSYIPIEIEFKYMCQIYNLLTHNINKYNYINVLMLANYFGYINMSDLITIVCKYLYTHNIHVTDKNVTIKDLRILIYNNWYYKLIKDLSYILYDDFICLDLSTCIYDYIYSLNFPSVFANPDFRIFKMIFKNCEFDVFNRNITIIVNIIETCEQYNNWHYLYYILYDPDVKLLLQFLKKNDYFKSTFIKLPFYIYDILDNLDI